MGEPMKIPTSVSESIDQQRELLTSELKQALASLSVVQAQEQELMNKVVGCRQALSMLQRYGESIGVLTPPNQETPHG